MLVAGFSRPRAISPLPAASSTARVPSIRPASTPSRPPKKLLKGFLAFHDRPYPHTHNLEELARLCCAIDPSLDFGHVDVTELTPFAVEMRYDFEFWPSREIAQEALDLATQVRHAILAAVPTQAKP